VRSVKRVTRRSNATGGTSFAVQQLNTLQLSAYAYTERKTASFALVGYSIAMEAGRGFVHRAFCFARID
jgi:hypothetical protein